MPHKPAKRICRPISSVDEIQKRPFHIDTCKAVLHPVAARVNGDVMPRVADE